MNSCSNCNKNALARLGVATGDWDYLVTLAGNPNTGKSTIFNALTGLKQHTGNWPGKTIARAEGGFSYSEKNFKIVDLPGTYSLLSATPDEEVARNFILFGQPDVTVIVVDATQLERNLNLTLQILQISDRVLVCLNLLNEARAKNIQVDSRGLARDLGVPVVEVEARQGKGMDRLLEEIRMMAAGEVVCAPRHVGFDVQGLRQAMNQIVKSLKKQFPEVPHLEWIALRLLEGDQRIIEAVETGELGTNPGVMGKGALL